MTKDVHMPKILFLVDDDPDDKDIFQEALRVIDQSIVCYTASDGKDALAQLREALFLPDVVFLDLNMPVMNGKDCLKELKQDKELKHIPVVVYSTSAAEKEKHNCLTLGAAHFISKPPQFNVLVNTLQETFQNDSLRLKK
ncbi:MAG TPA: response regulator [Chryseosolibacter sp.]|nr:response regulator [Chryseosolibacter sp.]